MTIDTPFKGVPNQPTGDDGVAEQVNAETIVRIPIDVPGQVRDSALSVESIQNRTWEEVRPADLGQVLLNAIRSGQIQPAVVTQLWPRQPWRMLEVFGNVLDQTSPMYARLLEWQAVGQTNPAFEPNFRALNVDLVDRMEALRSGLEAFLNAQQNSRQHLESLMSRRSSNWLDGAFRDYRRTINFQRDPALSAGLLIGGVMVAGWLIKSKTRFAGWARLGLGFTVLAIFLKKNYGIQISEDLLARPLEQWGAPQMANAVRVFRDMLRAPFMGTSQQGSAVALLEHRLKINGEEERATLAGILRMRPGQFLNAYNAAKRASLSPSGATQLPPEVTDLIREFQRNRGISDQFSGLNDNEKLRVFLKVADKYLVSLGQGADPQRALGFIENNFVTGQGYRVLIARANARRLRDGSLRADTQVTTEIEALETASDAAGSPMSDVTMLDISLATAGDDLWEGLRDFQSVEARRARELREGLIAAARGTRDTIVSGATDIRDFVLQDALPYLKEDAWPRVQRFAEEEAWPALKDLGRWADNKQYTFRKETDIGRLLEDLVGTTASASVEGIKISGREVKKLSVWVAYKRIEGTGVSFNNFKLWEAETRRTIEETSDGTVTIPLNPAENNTPIWRALHDLEIATIDNRDELGNGTDAASTTNITLSRAQATRLLAWLDVWRKIYLPGAAGSSGVRPRPAPAEMPEGVAALLQRLNKIGATLPAPNNLHFFAMPGSTNVRWAPGDIDPNFKHASPMVAITEGSILRAIAGDPNAANILREAYTKWSLSKRTPEDAISMDPFGGALPPGLRSVPPPSGGS